jgi:hypothetical protein
MDPRNGAVDLEEAHAGVEPHRPVGGEGHDTGVEPEGVLALIEKRDVLLDLRREERERATGKRRVVAEGHVEFEALKRVGPVPPRSLADELHVRGIARGELREAVRQRVPFGGAHVRRARGPRRIPSKDLRTLRELGVVPFVDVEDAVAPAPRGRLLHAERRLHVRGVPVGVVAEGEGETVEPRCGRDHRSSSSSESRQRETHGMIADARSSSLR